MNEELRQNEEIKEEIIEEVSENTETPEEKTIEL